MLSDVSLTFPDGAVTVILGASGCGKSTLAAVMCGLYPENGGFLESGSVSIGDTDILQLPFGRRCRYIAAMFQNPDLQFCMGCLRDELYFCLENVSTPPEDMDRLIREHAAEYGVEELLDRPFAMLSGGEKQKAALLCLMILHPKVLVLDEPFANLDPDGTRGCLELLRRRIAEEQVTVIAIDHKASNWIGTADYFLPLDENCHPAAAAENGLIRAGDLPAHSGLLCELGIEDPFAPVIRKQVRIHAEETVLQLENVSVFHQKRTGGQAPQLAGVTLQAGRGEMIACLGASGSGKTTFLLSLLREKTHTGRILLQGREIRSLRRRSLFASVGMVFQNPAIQFVTTAVHREVEESLRLAKDCPTEELEKRVDVLLEEFRLRHYRRYSPFMLSQGQQRRLSVLTMLAGGQCLLLLDEPTYGQDARTTAAVMRQLEEAAVKGITVIFTTHDRRLARTYADRIWQFADGRVSELTEEEESRLFAESRGGAV